VRSERSITRPTSLCESRSRPRLSASGLGPSLEAPAGAAFQTCAAGPVWSVVEHRALFGGRVYRPNRHGWMGANGRGFGTALEHEGSAHDPGRLRADRDQQRPYTLIERAGRRRDCGTRTVALGCTTVRISLSAKPTRRSRMPCILGLAPSPRHGLLMERASRTAAAPRSPWPQPRAGHFLPLGWRPFLARQESDRRAVLR